MPNICQKIINDPEETLGNCTGEEMADAAVTIIGMMSTDDVDSLAEKLAEDETAFDGLLSALERHQPA